MSLSFARSRVSLGASATLSLALATFGVPLLQAQGRSEPREGPSLALRGLRSGQCVRFLLEPGSAAKARRQGYRPIRADQDQSLHPALRNVLEAQPEFASWTSSSLCFFHVDTVSLAGRTIAEKNARKAQMIAVWTIAAMEQGSGARRDLVLDLIAGNPRVVRAAEAAKLQIREATSVSRTTENADELHDVKVGKTHVVWTGRPTGDSTKVEQPLQESWLVKGASGTEWGVRMTSRPAWSRPLVGFLSVEGKDDLAKALKSSPIRFVGPRYIGGSVELLFSR